MGEYFCAIIININIMANKKQEHHKNHQDSISQMSKKWALTYDPTFRFSEQDSQVIVEKWDTQGNPIDTNGKMRVKKVSSIDSIPDEYFTNPTIGIELPMLPKWLNHAIGAYEKPVIIKKNIFEKNCRNHPELRGVDSRKILFNALYKANLFGQTQPKSRPQYWIVMHTAEKNYMVILEVATNKDNVEIVGWRYSGRRQLKTLRKQAEREDGQLLILTPQKTEAAAGLSTLPPVVSDGKDNAEKPDTQEKGIKSPIL